MEAAIFISPSGSLRSPFLTPIKIPATKTQEESMEEGPITGVKMFARRINERQSPSEQLRPNEQETPELIIQGVNRVLGSVGKLLGPLAAILPTNPGRVSLFGGLETEGIADRPINQGKGLQGSNLYQALIAPLVANGTITDHARLPYADVPMESLGTLSPPGFDVQRGEGIALG